MEGITARCPSCGAPLKTDKFSDTITSCHYCKNDVVLNNALEYGKNYSDSDEISNLRKLLSTAVKSNDLKQISEISNAILTLIPSDYSAIYYFAYSKSMQGLPNYLDEFYKTSPEDYTHAELGQISNHIIKHSKLKDNKQVLEYLSNLPIDNKNDVLKLYDQTFNERYTEEEYYDVVQRDVFICHRSSDLETALKVLEIIESDGNTCWISSRNLRKNDNENYWKNIESAIDHCSIFLVISSQEAMLSNDVKKEMLIAKRLNKKRLELKIDNTEHTTFFKDFFDGNKWIKYSNSSETLEILNTRVFQLLSQRPATESINSNNSSSSKLNEELSRQLTMRAKLLIENKKYKDAKSLLENALNYNAENSQAYIGLLLVEFKQSKIEDLIYSSKQINNSVNYQSALKFSNEEEKYQLNRINESLGTILEKNRKENLYKNAIESYKNAKSRSQLESLLTIFENLDNYNESKMYYKEIFSRLNKSKYKNQNYLKDRNLYFYFLIAIWSAVFFFIPFGPALITSLIILVVIFVTRYNFSKKQFITQMILYTLSVIVNFIGWV